MEETRFYLLMVINEKFSSYMINEHKYMLLDMWLEEFEKIHKDFEEYDDSNRDLLSCVYDYVNLKYDEIKSVIDKSCESEYLVF